MDKYEVTFKDLRTGNEWSCSYWADDFGHAEEQAIDGLATEQAAVGAPHATERDPIVKITVEQG
jgi:hypothetical protein